MKNNTHELKRIPIPLDESVIIKLQGLYQARTGKRISVAALVRLAIEEMLKIEAELAD